MKRMIFATMIMLMSTFSFAQTNATVTTSKENAVEATKSGNKFVGLNTSSLGFTNTDGVTNTNVGLELGAFAVDNLAVVGTVGYGATTSENFNTNDWFYGAGLRYYVGSVLPLQVDWKGSTGNSFHPSTSYVGFQGGYAWFPFKNFSIEPTLRYDLSTKTEYKNTFSGKVGFNLFF